MNKEWKDNVSTKVTGDESKKIIGFLFFMLGDVFDYVETKEEMTCGMNHFHKYNNKIKSSSKSDYVTEAIEKIIISVKSNL